MKYKLVYLIISAAVIIPGLISLLTEGLKPSIDFTGGSVLELKIGVAREASPSAPLPSAPPANPPRPGQAAWTKEFVKPIRDFLAREKIDADVKETAGGITFRTQEIDERRKNEILAQISAKIVPVTESRFETLGPLLGRELLYKTLTGVTLAALLIAVYIIYQFKDLAFGLCATLATVHDSLVVLGVFSLLGKFYRVEVDILFVTAVLTVLSFSVHDTIVVYDRIREKMSRLGVTFARLNGPELEKIIDGATNETLGRSLNNSLTVIFMLTALFVLGGASIHWFALALLVGTVSGTYSSPFVAGPLLVVFKKIELWRAQRKLALP